MTAAPDNHVPLAERMRPRTFDRLYGQEHLLGKGKILAPLIEGGHPVSLIFWGPPGSGKTTLAAMLARHFDLPYTFFSAVLSGIKEVKEVMAQAESHRRLYGKPMIIFIDEIHRFNKAQQGAFLPYVERGDIVLFGSTTENPSFEVIAPLLSRTKVLVLNPLSEEALGAILGDALADETNGLGQRRLSLDAEARALLIDQCNGDARRALNTLELAAELAEGGRPHRGKRPRSPAKTDAALRQVGRRAFQHDLRPAQEPAQQRRAGRPVLAGPHAGRRGRSALYRPAPGPLRLGGRRAGRSPGLGDHFAGPRKPTIFWVLRKASWPWPRR